jgi:hypothetical protein
VPPAREYASATAATSPRPSSASAPRMIWPF